MRIEEYVGKRYGRLVVVSVTPRAEAIRQGKRDAVLHCKCDCGNASTQYANNLKKITSCGCFRRETQTKHGMSHHPVYAVWVQIIQRCENPHAIGYDEYGAKGIKVCERWHKFENFIKDMGPRPEVGRWTVERKDGKKGYNPKNCRWATFEEQSRNLKSNFKVKVNGKAVDSAPCRELSMKHALEDRVISPRAVANVIARLQLLERQALRFRAYKADGTEMEIPVDFAIGRSGGFRTARDLLEGLLLEAT